MENGTLLDSILELNTTCVENPEELGQELFRGLADGIMTGWVVGSGTVALVLNGIVIGMSVVLKSLEGKDFRWFVLNHAFLTLQFAAFTTIVRLFLVGMGK